MQCYGICDHLRVQNLGLITTYIYTGNGFTTTFMYKANGFTTTSMYNANGFTTTFMYNANGFTTTYMHSANGFTTPTSKMLMYLPPTICTSLRDLGPPIYGFMIT